MRYRRFIPSVLALSTFSLAGMPNGIAMAAPAASADAEKVDDGGEGFVLPEVDFERLKVEEVIEFLQKQTKSFRATVVRTGGGDGPRITMRLKNVSVGQVLSILTINYEGVQSSVVAGPAGPVKVITVAPPDGGRFGAEAEPVVRVYHLSGILGAAMDRRLQIKNENLSTEEREKKAKEDLNNVLSLVKASLVLAGPDEETTIKVHEETQTLLFRGSNTQRLALEDALYALENPQAVRPQTRGGEAGAVALKARLDQESAKAALDRAKGDVDRARMEAEETRVEEMRHARSLEDKILQLTAEMKAREVKSDEEIRRLQEIIQSKAAPSTGPTNK